MSNCNCAYFGGPWCRCNAGEKYAPPLYVSSSTAPYYAALEDYGPFKKLELKLVEQSVVIDTLQQNLEALHKTVDRIEKALDSICG